MTNQPDRSAVDSQVSPCNTWCVVDMSIDMLGSDVHAKPTLDTGVLRDIRRSVVV